MGVEESETGLNAKSTLAQQDIRYARSVKRLQRALIFAFRRYIDIHHAARGINPKTTPYRLMMSSVSNLDEQEVVETIGGRADTAQKLADLGDRLGVMDKAEWAKYILREIIRMDMQDIDRVLTQEEEESSDEEGGGATPPTSKTIPKEAKLSIRKLLQDGGYEDLERRDFRRDVRELKLASEGKDLYGNPIDLGPLPPSSQSEPQKLQ